MLPDPDRYNFTMRGTALMEEEMRLMEEGSLLTVSHGNEILPYLVARLSRGGYDPYDVLDGLINDPSRIRLLFNMIEHEELSPFEHMWTTICFRQGVLDRLDKDVKDILFFNNYIIKDDLLMHYAAWLNGYKDVDMCFDINLRTLLEKLNSWPLIHYIIQRTAPLSASAYGVVEFSRGIDEYVIEQAEYLKASISELPRDDPIRYIIRSPHRVFYSFMIECSRACSHQLVRHRTISFIQESNRVMKPRAPSNYTLEQIPEQYRDEALELWYTMRKIYDQLVSGGLPREIARYVMPSMTSTRLWATAHVGNWSNFIYVRNSPHAQSEIRGIAQRIDKLIDEGRYRIRGW